MKMSKDMMVTLLRDPDVHLAVERDALRTVRAWVSEQVVTLPIDRHVWDSDQSLKSGANVCPSCGGTGYRGGVCHACCYRDGEPIGDEPEWD